jgi:hypothetical protein
MWPLSLVRLLIKRKIRICILRLGPCSSITGKLPRIKIQFKVRAAILPIPLPKETGLPETGDTGVGEAILGIQHTAHMFAAVDGFCKDEEVEAIKLTSGARGLYVWGWVTYEDVFGNSHYTRFCQQIYWTGNDSKIVQGMYVPGRNEST